MQIEISISMRDLVEAVRDLYKKRGGSIPESLSQSNLQMPNSSKRRPIDWPESWTEPFLEVVCVEPVKK